MKRKKESPPKRLILISSKRQVLDKVSRGALADAQREEVLCRGLVEQVAHVEERAAAYPELSLGLQCLEAFHCFLGRDDGADCVHVQSALEGLYCVDVKGRVGYVFSSCVGCFCC